MPVTGSASKGPSLLWVTDEAPDRLGGGGSIRQAHLLVALAERFDVHLLTTGVLRDPEVRAVLSGLVELPRPELVAARYELQRRTATMANALLGRYPSDMRLVRRSRVLLTAELARRHDDFDVVLVVNSEMGPVLPRGRTSVSVIDFHHLPSVVCRHRADAAPGRRQRWLHSLDARKAARLERHQMADYDVAISCSDDDAAVLQASGARRVIVAPNGVSLSTFRVTPVPSAKRLLFPGTLDYVPNIDGASWLCSEILPLVRAAVPTVELEIVGRSPAEEVRALGGLSGVTVHSDVPTLVPFFESARVVVVPLRLGSGTRLKALEAMAAARPLVGTTIGLAGLGIVDGEHALVADDASAIAAALVDVLTDDRRAADLAMNGRALVERLYGWDAIGSAFADELAAAVLAPSTRGSA
jgi:glycosyltransferase involved in cell wall biosynthesis